MRTNVGILGPLDLRVEDQMVAVPAGKQRVLLCFLLLHAPEYVTSDAVIEAVWPEADAVSGARTLQVTVSRLRKSLGPAGPALETLPAGYRFAIERDSIDASRFEQLVGRAQQASAAGDPSLAGELTRDALALWRGPPLADAAFASFAQPEIARLEELRVTAEEQRVDAAMALGGHASVVADLERLTAAHPSRERFLRQLMLALYRTGRQADALAAYREGRRRLDDELGLALSPETRELEEAILRQDAALLDPPRAADPEPADEPAGPAADDDPPSARETRKVVTALLCDVTISTGELDPEVLHSVFGRCLGVIEATLARHGGTVHLASGDAALAVFGVPRVHEDDALRAVRAAAEIRERLPDLADETGVPVLFRAGVSTGSILSTSDGRAPIGDPMTVAARLEQAAQPGEILLAAETVILVRDAATVERIGPVAVRGRPRPVDAHRLLGVDAVAPAFARRLDTPLVGRRRELHLLRDAYDRAVHERDCHLFTLLGAAGVGKSRLIAELLADVADDATVLRGRCLPYGEGITFHALTEALRPAGAVAEPTLEQLATGSVARPQELYWEVRRLLERLAADRPVILHVDDLHWAESMLFDLLDHVVELSRGAPILVLCSARAELLEDRPNWGGGKLNATSVLLTPLEPHESELLLERLGGDLDGPVRERIVAASEGNPLFLEEMAALARDSGTVAVPPTIHALLAARLERLDDAERTLLERGAVEGEVFHRGALAALIDGPPAQTEDNLAALVRRELIRPHTAAVPGEEAFRFRHLLLRDVAYDALPLGLRADLHERFAAWLEAGAAELAELDEIAAWHQERALDCRSRLGRPLDPKLARRAAEHLLAAGERAAARSDVDAARTLLERSLPLAGDDASLHPRIAVALAAQLTDQGELARSDELLSAAETAAPGVPNVTLARLEWMKSAQPEAAGDDLRVRLPRTITALEAAGDDRGLARAHLLAYEVPHFATRNEQAREELRLAIEHARRAGDEGLLATAVSWYVASLYVGPVHADTMRGEYEALAGEPLTPYAQATLTMGRAHLAKLSGDYATAAALCERALEAYRSLGLRLRAAQAMQNPAWIAFAAGDARAALSHLQASDAMLAEFGERPVRSTTVAYIARAHVLLGEREPAERALQLAEELYPGDPLNAAIGGGVRARLCLADGRLEEAERWARSAVDIAWTTDGPDIRAETRIELALVLRAAGRPGEAAAEARHARDEYVSKGDGPNAARVRALLDEIERPETDPVMARAPRP